jgi:hypothetical protein
LIIPLGSPRFSTTRNQAISHAGYTREVDHSPGRRQSTIHQGLVGVGGVAAHGEFRLVVDSGQGVDTDHGVLIVEYAIFESFTK